MQGQMQELVAENNRIRKEMRQEYDQMAHSMQQRLEASKEEAEKYQTELEQTLHKQNNDRMLIMDVIEKQSKKI